MRCYAVLIDTVGIQKYVFSSRKLRENLGASYLVQSIYDTPLYQSLTKLLPNVSHTDLKKWQAEPNYIAIKHGSPVEIAYIGGGNAMLFFTSDVTAKEFIKDWSKHLLVYAPGLNTAVALGEFDTDDFVNSKNRLFKALSINKSHYAPNTIIPSHGITAECSHSGYSMDIYNHSEQRFVSCMTNAKIESVEFAKTQIHELFKDELGSEYLFTDDISSLGQTKHEDSHIAIVHIDGNGMGDRFASQTSLSALRELSKTVNQATIEAVKAMIRAIKDHKDMLLRFLDRENFPKTPDGREILPFRPIIIGGDDITFVSEGRLGIWLAEQFLLAFEGQKVSDGKPLSACAGVAITRTKYPFYRGYVLSEQLCKSAKQKRLSSGQLGSWIDFHIAFGGISGDLKHIRNLQYTASQGSLLMRPYCLKSDIAKYDFQTLKANTKTLASLPNSKIKEMRTVLTLGKNQTEVFVKELKARGDDKHIPEIEGYGYKPCLFENAETPYFDMIELMEFYPDLKEARK